MDNVDDFSVYTYTIVNRYMRWSEGLVMMVSKNGVDIKLESHEICQIIAVLPSTIGGSY